MSINLTTYANEGVGGAGAWGGKGSWFIQEGFLVIGRERGAGGGWW